MNRVAEIKKVIRSAEFRVLQKVGAKPLPFNLLAVIERTVTENAWSRILAFLFDSRRNHGLDKRAVLTWLKLVDCDQEILAVVHRKDIVCVVENEWGAFDRRRLDLLIRFVDRKGKTKSVVGIENKVWSGEQPEQLSHYQKALCRAFPRVPKTLMFLTPDVREPTTADLMNLQCPCLSRQYESLIELCRELRALQITRDIRLLLQHLESYMSEQIIKSARDIKRAKTLIQNLYRQPQLRNALHFIRDHLPSVGDVVERVKPKVERELAHSTPNARPEWMYWPIRSSSPQEIKLSLGELNQRTGFGRKRFWIHYMLRCPKPLPEIGDEFTMVVAAWFDKGASPEVLKLLTLPDPVGEWRPHDKHWLPLWTGESYRLVDLGQADARGLEQIMVNALKRTYPLLKRRVFKHFPSKQKG